MRAWTTGLVGIVVVGLILATVGACAGDPVGSRAASRSTSAPMPALPADPHAAMLEVRRLLVEQIAPLLRDSGQRWTEARYLLTTADTDETAYQGHLFVTVGADAADGADPSRGMAVAARARGWTDGGISHRLNVVRGPYRLTASPRPDGGWRYEVATPALTPATRIEGTERSGGAGGAEDASAGAVPELDDYRAGG